MNDPLAPEAVQAFWVWVADHLPELDALASPDDPFWDDLLAQLHALDEGLWFELAPPRDETRQLVLTAHGEEALFPLVEAIAAEAPPLPGWAVVALKPGLGFDFDLRHGGRSFEPATLWCQPLQGGGGGPAGVLGLRVALPGYDEDEEDELAHAVLLLLAHALGERTAATEVELRDLCGVPLDPEDDGFFPLPELVRFLAWRREAEAEAQAESEARNTPGPAA